MLRWRELSRSLRWRARSIGRRSGEAHTIIAVGGEPMLPHVR